MWPYGPLVRLCERLDLYLSLHLFDMLADGNALNFLIDNNFQLIIGLGVVMSLLTLLVSSGSSLSATFEEDKILRKCQYRLLIVNLSKFINDIQKQLNK